MTLEELLKAMNDAVAASKAAPDDAGLKAKADEATTAYNTAKEAADADPDEDELDEDSLDEKTKKHIAKLRKENASHRLKNKDLASSVKAEKARVNAILKAAGIESEDDAPEEKIKGLTSENQTIAFRNAVLESALQHGIPHDGLKYFQFLVSEAVGELEEGEELSDDKLKLIAADAKKKSGKTATSTVGGGGGGGGGGNPPPPGGSGAITLEKFCAMGMVEKSKLYETNRDLYLALMAEAKSKKKLV